MKITPFCPCHGLQPELGCDVELELVTHSDAFGPHIRFSDPTDHGLQLIFKLEEVESLAAWCQHVMRREG